MTKTKKPKGPPEDLCIQCIADKKKKPKRVAIKKSRMCIACYSKHRRDAGEVPSSVFEQQLLKTVEELNRKIDQIYQRVIPEGTNP